MRKIVPFLTLIVVLFSNKAWGQYVWVAQDNNTHYVDVEFRLKLDHPVLLTAEHQPALTYLSMVIDTYRDKIKSGEWKVWVESYVQQPEWSIAQNRAVAKVTSNVVKSYMIYAGGLKEEHFTTKNYSGTLDQRQGITEVIIGARYPLDRILPLQRIDWETSDLAWLTQTARNNPLMEVTVGTPDKAPLPGTDTIRIELPDFESLVFTYRQSTDSEWKKSSVSQAAQAFLPNWHSSSTGNDMAVWGLAANTNTPDSSHLGVLEYPLVAVQYDKTSWGASTKVSASRNAEALAEIGAMIEANRAALQQGTCQIYVDSYIYGDSLAPASARAQARIQSNTLKSYLMATYGVSESQFSTRNHSGLFDNQSAISVVTLAKKQPTDYMAGLQTIDLPINDGSWRPAPANVRYRSAYADQEKAQMEYVNQRLSGMDLNVLTAPWSAARMQDVTGFVDGAPTAGQETPTPSNNSAHIGVSSLGTLGDIIASNTPAKGSKTKRIKQVELSQAVGLGLGPMVGITEPTPKPLKIGGRRGQNELTAVVDAAGKISIDATGFQRKMTAETQAQIAAENRAIIQAEERALRESRLYQRKQESLAARKAKGRFAVFGVGINALSSAAFIPAAQIDAYFSDRFSAVVEGYYSKWNFSEDNKFNLEMISPELRYFPLGRIKQFSKLYVGVYGALGNYNMRWGGKRSGIQSNFWSVGISAGYILPLGKTPLYLDMGIAGGFVSESVDRYVYHQGHNYFLEHYTNMTFFPVKAKVSIVCRIFNER